jgi:hypothetical protein
MYLKNLVPQSTCVLGRNVKNYVGKMLDFKNLHEKQAVFQCCGSGMFVPDPDP